MPSHLHPTEHGGSHRCASDHMVYLTGSIDEKPNSAHLDTPPWCGTLKSLYFEPALCLEVDFDSVCLYTNTFRGFLPICISSMCLSSIRLLRTWQSLSSHSVLYRFVENVGELTLIIKIGMKQSMITHGQVYKVKFIGLWWIKANKTEMASDFI